eukprot:scaffold5215_cov181-Amphora_coffeaeformis.AAC.1
MQCRGGEHPNGYVPKGEETREARTHSGYPLGIEATTVIVEKTPFDREMILKMLPRLNYDAVVAANKQLSLKTEGTITELPEKLPSEIDDELLQALHHVLYDIHLVEGFL